MERLGTAVIGSTEFSDLDQVRRYVASLEKVKDNHFVVLTNPNGFVASAARSRGITVEVVGTEETALDVTQCGIFFWTGKIGDAKTAESIRYAKGKGYAITISIPYATPYDPQVRGLVEKTFGHGCSWPRVRTKRERISNAGD